MIPSDAKKTEDGRFKATESLLTAIDRKKMELDSKRPPTEGELERLTEEFIIEYTYNSNAIEGNTLTLRETDMVLRGLTIDKKSLNLRGFILLLERKVIQYDIFGGKNDSENDNS